MISFARTFDYELARQIISHPKLYRWLSDDSCPTAEEFRPLESESVWYVEITKDGELQGMFVFAPQTGISWEVHTCLLPVAWGSGSLLAQECIRWMWLNSSCQRITTSVPENNRLALKLSRDAGLTEYGRNQKCWMKQGKLYDMILLGISKI